MIKFGYIYKITLPDGRFYFGKKEKPKELDYYYGSGRIISDWFKKHTNRRSCNCPSKYAKKIGVKREVIWWASNRECLKCMEKIIIGNLYKNNSNCINLCQGGTFGGATPKTEKWRRAIKKALCGKKQTQEHKDKVKKQLIKNREIFREKAKKQWENPEFRRKMSEIHKQLWATEEFRRKNAEGWVKRKKD